MGMDRTRNNLEPWFPIRDVADALGVSISTVRRFVKDGKLRAVKTGHLWRIPASSLTEFREANTHFVERDEGARVGKEG